MNSIKARCIYKTRSLSTVPSTVCHLSPLGRVQLPWQYHAQSSSEMLSFILLMNPSTGHIPCFDTLGQPLRGDKGTTPSFTITLICSVEAREGSAQDNTIRGKRIGTIVNSCLFASGWVETYVGIGYWSRREQDVKSGKTFS